MSIQSANTSFAPQTITVTDSPAPSAPTSHEALVVKAVHTAAELAEIAQDLAKIQAMQDQLNDGLAAYAKAETGSAAQAALHAQLQDLVDDLNTLKQRTATKETAFLHVRSLQAQHLELHQHLSAGGLSQREIDHTVWKMEQVEHELERAQFDAAGGGTTREFVQYQVDNRQRAIGTFQSRLNDGGLNWDDAHSLRSRIRDAEADLASAQKWLNQKENQ